MKLHIFNPSHDEALAAHSPYYYPSGAARKLAVEWCQLPAIWAEAGDAVWIPDEAAKPQWEEREEKAAGRMSDRIPGRTPDNISDYISDRTPDKAAGRISGKISGRTPDNISEKISDRTPDKTPGRIAGSDLNWLYARELTATVWNEVEEIVPWGWDLLLCHQLRKAGAPERLLPDAERLDTLRTLSSRQTTTEVLPLLKKALTGFPLPLVGESVLAKSETEVSLLLKEHTALMVKALWSCSGRGVFRLTEATETAAGSTWGRIRKLIREQGAVELQPVYERDTDFALEFTADADGKVRCEGFSHFITHPTGQYAGNLVAAPEALEKRTAELLGSAEAATQLCGTLEQTLTHCLAGRYAGPLGVDLMTVRTEKGNALMPCVEINLRRTMGHTALHLSQKMNDGQLKATDIPTGIRKLWYFCAQFT